MQDRRLLCVLNLAFITLIAMMSSPASGADVPPKQGLLQLANGDRIPGRFSAISPATDKGAQTVTWDSPLFRDPLLIQMLPGTRLRFDSPDETPNEPFYITLNNGDVLRGRPVGSDEERIQFSGRRHGEFSLPLSAIRRIHRQRGLFDGPGGLDGWVAPSDPDDEARWTANAFGHLTTKSDGAQLFRPLKISGAVEIEVELQSRTEAPSFTLGVTRAGNRGTVLTTFGPDLIVLSHDEGSSIESPDVEILDVPDSVRKHHLRLRWEPSRHRMTVFTRDYRQLGELSVSKRDYHGGDRTGLYLENLGDDLTVTTLRVSAFYGNSAATAEQVVVLKDQSVQPGRIVAVTNDSLTLSVDDQEQSIPLTNVRDIVLSKARADKEAENASTSNSVFTWADGGVLTGTIQNSDGDRVEMASVVAGGIAASLTGLQSIVVPGTKRKSRSGKDTLTSSLTRGLHGTVEFRAGKNPIIWRQDQTEKAVRLHVDASARITRKDPTQRAFERNYFRQRLYLNNGDVVPCKLLSATTDEFFIQHPFGKTDRIAAKDVRAIQFSTSRLPGTESRTFSLTIPRFREHDPFSHALIAKNGDILRGQLISLDEKNVLFDSRGDDMRFPCSLLRSIVCVNPDEVVVSDKDSKTKDDSLPKDSDATDSKKESQPGDVDGAKKNLDQATVVNAESKPSAAVAQLHLEDGYMLSMNVGSTESNSLKGTSDVLGDVSLDHRAVAEILFQPKEVQHRYRRWVPLAATQPRWQKSAGGPPPDLAKLIGQPAADFSGAELSKDTFRLADHKGKIVVLDFWATWCGPCVRGLPEYLAAVEEFDPEDVVFLGINSSESPKAIRSFVEKRKLNNFRIFLDHDQSVASAYQVGGIPHTVVIGRDGTIEDIHVGYSPTAAKELQSTIRQMLNGTWKRPSAEKTAE